MSDPQRSRVRVRRSPRIGVFVGIGAVLGALVAIVAVNVTPADATTPRIQAIGFLVLLLAPVGALLGGVVALVLEAVLERRARTVDAERIPTTPPLLEGTTSAADDAAPTAGAPGPIEQDAPDRT